jgi:hypothetical protein
MVVVVVVLTVVLWRGVAMVSRFLGGVSSSEVGPRLILVMIIMKTEL